MANASNPQNTHIAPSRPSDGFWGDYHTHTVYSHGKGGPEDNVLAAARRGLKEIAITDHGFNHMTYGVRRYELPFLRDTVAWLREKYAQMKIYLGVEANILTRSGKIDVREKDKPYLDIVVCGYHKLVWGASPAYFFSNNLGWSTAKTVARNTDAYVNAVTRNRIDILSHPGNGCPCDIRAVARACKQTGTLFELNGKRMYISDEQLEAAADEGAMFICDSDAHAPKRIGDFSLPLARLRAVGVPLAQVANYGRRPELRSFAEEDVCAK